MQNFASAALAHVGRLFLMVSLAGAMSITVPGPVDAQRATGAERPDDRNTSRVLGNMELTAADNVVKEVVDLLDFESYKALIKGLTEFGDREQGTPRNAAAIDWIEAQLQSWGYETERIYYQFTPRGGTVSEPPASSPDGRSRSSSRPSRNRPGSGTSSFRWGEPARSPPPRFSNRCS